MNFDRLKLLFLANKKRISVIFAMILFVAATGVTCAFNLKKDVTVTVNEHKAGVTAETKVIQNANLNHTVRELLETNAYPTDNSYKVSADLDASIRDVDNISIDKLVTGTVSVDAQNMAYSSGAATVGDLLTELGVTLGATDQVSPAVETPLTSDITAITVTRVEVKEEQREEEIPFATTETEDASIASGTTQVDTQGVNGKKVVTEKVTYSNGQPVSRELVKENITTAPVNQVQRKGTAAAGSTASAASAASTTSTTTGNATAGLSASDFDLVCAIVQHEGGSSYEGALAVMSCVMNRCDKSGSGPVAVLTAPGQFSSYLDGYYTQFLGNTSSTVQQAVTDCLNGTRSHPYTSFRSYETSGSVCIGGNWFF